MPGRDDHVLQYTVFSRIDVHHIHAHPGMIEKAPTDGLNALRTLGSDIVGGSVHAAGPVRSGVHQAGQAEEADAARGGEHQRIRGRGGGRLGGAAAERAHQQPDGAGQERAAGHDLAAAPALRAEKRAYVDAQ